MRLRACCCSGSKLSSDRTPLPNLNRTISSSFLLMALPFIVGPHQCSLTQGPEGRPQVEVVLRIRLPLAEFFDAFLLSLAEQHPLFQQTGHEPAPTPAAPVKAGLQLAVDSLHTSISHMGIFNIVLRRTERMSIYHRRVHLHTQRSAPSSESVERPNAPLSILTRAPYQTSPFVSADLWLRARETTCQPALFCIVLAGFRLHTLL